MSVHLSLLSQMKTVSDSIYDVQGIVLLFLVVFTGSEEGNISRICKFVTHSGVNKSVCQRHANL